MLVKLTWELYGKLKSAIDIIECVKDTTAGTATEQENGDSITWGNYGVRIDLKERAQNGQKKYHPDPRD